MTVKRPGKGKKPTVSQDKNGNYRVTPKQPPKSNLEKMDDRINNKLKAWDKRNLG